MADEKLMLNDEGTHVFVYNPDSGGTWWSPVDYLPVARKLGWEPAQPRQDVLEGLVDPPQEQFDPSKHNVQEVNDYLAANAESNPAEVIRVLAAESDGNNRKSVVPPDGFDTSEEA